MFYKDIIKRQSELHVYSLPKGLSVEISSESNDDDYERTNLTIAAD